jgi:hypothetical protein
MKKCAKSPYPDYLAGKKKIITYCGVIELFLKYLIGPYLRPKACPHFIIRQTLFFVILSL